MKTKIFKEGKPIKLWLDYLEDGAMTQAKNLSKLPSLFKHVAIMSDSHQGYGMPIGGVIALKDAVIPNAVGVDIGCGVLAVQTDMEGFSREGLETLRSEIMDLIPVGFKHREEPIGLAQMPKLEGLISPIILDQYENARFQMGTLGGGNHFIEIQEDEQGKYWIMIHSGSRNLGYKVANYYNDVAKTVAKKINSNVPTSWDLATIPRSSEYFTEYMDAMNYCIEFALANRMKMMYDIQDLVGFNNTKIVNIAHNYAKEEEHFGERVIVHRKGATLATKGTIGIIPGSMGTRSYIVQGKGNEDSFNSCSHGAGRKMSRSKAKKDLCLFDELDKLGSVIHGMKSEKYLDEAVGAYKDIDVVMENQKDLVDIVHILKPLVSIKG